MGTAGANDTGCRVPDSPFFVLRKLTAAGRGGGSVYDVYGGEPQRGVAGPTTERSGSGSQARAEL